MVQYTEEFLAAARQGYETTDQPMRELARELGIGITTLSTLAEKNGWAKRSLRQRGLPPAMQLLEEVKALAGGGLAPGAEAPPTPNPFPPLAALAEGGEQSALGPSELLIKLQQILAQLIAAQQLAPANGIHSPQAARTLTMLVQAMRMLQGMRGGQSISQESHKDDDDMPRDIDEFRHALARRIEALFESETDAENADANSGCTDVDGGRQ